MVCVLGVLAAQAQSGTVRGTVIDKDTGEPIPFCSVIIQGTTQGAESDIDGFFTLPEVPAGDRTLFVTYVGYDSVFVDVKVRENGVSFEKIYLTEAGINLQTVNIKASREQARNEVLVSKITVTPRQIKTLPSTGGEADIAQYLPVLPGIIFSGDQGGQLYIRGGSPVQNKVLLDGMTIYNPFHSIGFFSVFETETIRSVDVLTGGFNAEHGGRVSAIVNINTRDGNKKRHSGLISASPFQAKALFEGPIKKLNEETGTAISYMVTGKRSLLGETSTSLYSYVNDSLGLPYDYTDIYGKVTIEAGNGSKINLFGFNFDDDVVFDNVAAYDWKASGGGTRISLIPSNTAMVVGGNFSFSRYAINFDDFSGRPRSSEVKGFTAGLDFQSFGANSEVNYGFELNGLRTDFQFVNFLDLNVEQFQNVTELAGFVKYKHKFGNLIIEPGVRAMFYASLSEVSLEPRFGLKYNITDGLRFKLGAGIYSQNLISSVNELDVVNLFVGFLSGPEETIFKPGTNEPTDTRLQKSKHAVAGFEIDIGNNIQVNVEPYFKNFDQLIAINRNKLSERDPDFMAEEGEAYGIDFSFKYDYRALYLWATYSLGRVTRFDGEQEFPTIFDRRHNVNLVASYSFGADNSWEAGARWNLGSGFPFTLTQGFYNLQTFAGGLETDPNTDNGNLGIIYADERNSGRLPYYHRLDLSLKKTIDFGRYTSLEVIASVTNAYDRENIFFFDRIEFERVDQLPILPSLGATFKF